jgi:gas vesicle protein
MVEEPDRLRDQIEATRADLSRDVDRLADRTSPSRVVQRRWSSMKEKTRGVTQRIMGQSREAADSVQDMSHQAADKVRGVPRELANQTQGNPVAVGVIAFGVGLLAASLIPTTDIERRAGQELRENAGELYDRVRKPLTESAQQLKDDVSGSVREAASQVKETARDAGQETADRARQAVDETRATYGS